MQAATRVPDADTFKHALGVMDLSGGQAKRGPEKPTNMVEPKPTNTVESKCPC